MNPLPYFVSERLGQFDEIKLNVIQIMLGVIFAVQTDVDEKEAKERFENPGNFQEKAETKEKRKTIKEQLENCVKLAEENLKDPAQAIDIIQELQRKEAVGKFFLHLFRIFLLIIK